MPRFRTAACVVAICVLTPLLGGCARYEYDLVAPPELARHVGAKSDEVLRVDPLDYRLRTADNRLVVDIVNPTQDAITLLGGQSYVVAPSGQSHPLRVRTIAPGTYIRMILPPMRPYYRTRGPTFGIGLGVGISSRFHGRGYFPGPFHDPFFDEPRYYALYDESDATYWDWNGETEVRLHLVYQRQGNAETFSDDFTFKRKKM